jgi:hypothetical protein
MSHDSRTLVEHKTPESNKSEEEIAMEKTKETVYYYTFINEKGETVRPRRPGTLEAIKNTSLASATPLMSTALEVDEANLDEDGFYPREL